MDLSVPGKAYLAGVDATTLLNLALTDAQTPANAIRAGVRYRVVCDVDCFIRVGAAAAVDGTSIPLFAKTPVIMAFANAGASSPVVHGIVGTGTGKLYFTPLYEAQL